jgi:hypothetical protein
MDIPDNSPAIGLEWQRTRVAYTALTDRIAALVLAGGKVNPKVKEAFADCSTALDEMQAAAHAYRDAMAIIASKLAAERADVIDNNDDIATWQDMVRDKLLAGLKEMGMRGDIDGGGCDSGDWRDFTLAEIQDFIVRVTDWHYGRTTPSASDVLAERQRQVTAEGWWPEHDDKHVDHSLAIAAACYALGDRQDFHDSIFNEMFRVPDLWPRGWHDSWWKPTDPRRNLVKAGALILAEIERIDRASAKEAAGG